MAKHHRSDIEDVAGPIKELRHAPTREGWRRELANLFSHGRDELLAHIGSPKQYVERIIADADNSAIAKLEFNLALADCVTEWHPDHETAFANVQLLRLVAGFTPVNGFGRILGYLKQWNSIDSGIPITPGSDDDTHALALLALASYYKVGPDAAQYSGSNFADYIQLLWRHADQPTYAPHAIRRLIELRQLRFDNNETRTLMTGLLQMNGVLAEFIQFALGINFGILNEYLPSLVNLSLEFRDQRKPTDPFWLFRSLAIELGRYGSSLSIDNRGFPFEICIPRHMPIGLNISVLAKQNYYQATSLAEQNVFDSKFPHMLTR